MFSQLLPGLRATIVLAIYTGLIFPLVITGIAQVLFPFQANGSLLLSPDKKTVIGSALLAQGFAKPEYFHPRPSAAANGYAGEASGGTNLGPTSKKLIEGATGFPGVKELAQAFRTENNLPADYAVPVDAVTRSSSGLDPDITPANAELQVARVAKARNVSADIVRSLLVKYTNGRQFGFFGEPRVNVLQLNLALDQEAAHKTISQAAQVPHLR